jgi:hypothetical protein
MSNFGEDFLQGFFGADGLKDYTHASKTFRTNGYELSPRYKFLFHVFFNINTGQIPALQQVFGNGDVATVGLMVKSVQLPTYSIDVDTMNQYNRKRLVQSKINYNPVQIIFNDDQGDLIRNMWYNYYSYYYKDPSQKYEAVPNTNGTIGNLATLSNGFSYNARDIYDNSRQVSDWGYIGEGYQDSAFFGPSLGNPNKPPFFRDIKIYGLSQKKYAAYVLINPMISGWDHDTYDYSAGNGVMTNTMSIQYETVKYWTGAIGGAQPSNPVSGFADPDHYDTRRSALARPGSTNSVFGQGGIIDAGAGILEDLQAKNLQGIIGAVQKAGTAYETSQRITRAGINEELRTGANQVLRASLPGAVRLAVNKSNGMIFPTPQK